MLFGKIDPTDIDLTSEGLYSLTDETKEKIASIPEDEKFEIYLFDYGEDNSIVDLAKQYVDVNKNITVETTTVEDRPDIAEKYNVEEGYGTVLIISGNKNKSYTYYDFYTYDYNTGNNIDITEERLTNGILALSSARCYNKCI